MECYMRFAGNADDMKADLLQPHLTNEELHQLLLESIGHWNVQEAKYRPNKAHSSGRWKGFARFWTFLRLIHTSLQALKASSVDVEDGDQDLQDPPEEAAGGGLSGPKDLLQKLRAMQQKKPVMDVVCSVLQDDQIRKLGWLIWSSRIVLQRSYQTLLEQLSSNENAARDLQINWANRHWAAEIGNIFLMLGNEEILHRLGLLAGADDVAETNRMAKMLGEILVRTASQRCWTMASWSELPPLNWSSVLSQDPEEARAGLDRIRGDQESVEAAWSYLNSADFHEESQGLKFAFDNLWVHRLTLVQESGRVVSQVFVFIEHGQRYAPKPTLHMGPMMLVARVVSECLQETWQHCRHFGWHPDSYYNHFWRLASTLISTKDLLEDVFADIADHEERDKKSSTPMMPETVFFYNTMSERLGNVPFLQIQAGDFTSAAARKFSAGRGETFGEKFKIKNAVTEKMKECCKHRDSSSAVKPSGQAADFRSIGAMLALRELGPSRFHGIGGCWVGCLLQEGMVYRHLSSKKVYLSLGFQHQALFGWELEELEDETNGTFFFLAESRMTVQQFIGKLEPIVAHELGQGKEAFAGVPCPPCTRTCREQDGVVLRKDGDESLLLPFWLRYGVLNPTIKAHLPKLIFASGAPLLKYNEKTVGVKSRMSLIKHSFPDMDEVRQAEVLDRLLQSDATIKSKLIRPDSLKDVLVEMDGTTDGKLFTDMKDMLDQEDRETFILTRFAAPRAAAEAATPWYIKNLRPPMTKCYLTWQVATKSFQGYYPKTLDESQRKNPKVKTHWSTSRTFGEKWTTEQALTQVVRFLWRKHKKGGHECSLEPNKQKISDGLEKASMVLEGTIEDCQPDVLEDAPDDKTTDEVMSKNAEEVPERETSNEGNDGQVQAMSSSSISESDSSGDGDPDGAAASSSKAKGKSQKSKAESKKGAAAKGKAKAKNRKKQTPKNEPAPKTGGTKRKLQELDTSSVVIPNHMKVKAAFGDIKRKPK
ncbi:unnamed protein product [Cladocopium goreaui]|uniref:Hemicentin-1 n=1 Tax=Cladocopium goreaui TaxID=2562237 RepID=A0A9P1CZ89_9DINO|nr:unnamed protein product [Cladocopium goreaui]